MISHKKKLNFIEFKQNIHRDSLEELPEKIEESLEVLKMILNKKDLKIKDKRKKFNSCEKNFIISFNASSNYEEDFAMMTDWSYVESLIIEKFKEKSLSTENLNDPVCIELNDEFDKNYEKYC